MIWQLQYAYYKLQLLHITVKIYIIFNLKIEFNRFRIKFKPNMYPAPKKKMKITLTAHSFWNYNINIYPYKTIKDWNKIKYDEFCNVHLIYLRFFFSLCTIWQKYSTYLSIYTKGSICSPLNLCIYLACIDSISRHPVHRSAHTLYARDIVQKFSAYFRIRSASLIDDPIWSDIHWGTGHRCRHI